MYKSLYKLGSNPFELDPDPFFLWLGGKHKEALSVLRYGILDNLGFVLLAGAAGTGKTILIKDFTSKLKSHVVWAVISDPNLERIDLYNKIGTVFGLEKQFISKVQFLIQFSNFLHKIHSEDKKAVLFVDDCHLLNQDILEELHVLSSIEKDETKLIDIFFVGQLEFNDILGQPKNKAIRQRLGLKAKLEPLGSNETVEYIRHRLKIAGSVEKIFTARAFQVIHQYSRGVPRTINLICKEALQTGSLQDEKTIDHNLILECVQKLKLPVPPDLTELIPASVEKKRVEHVEQVTRIERVDRTESFVDDFAAIQGGRQVTIAGLIAKRRKRRVLLFGTVSLLACIALVFYFSSPEEDVPVVAEIDDAIAAQAENTAVDQKVFPLPDTKVLKEVSTAVSDEQGDRALENLVTEEVSAEDAPDGGFQVTETAQLDSGGIEAEDVPVLVENDEKVIEKEEEVIESVVPAAEPEQEILPALPPLEQETVILGFQPNTSRLTIDADRILTEFVETLLQYSDAKILVKGFVSSNNDTLENIQLSEKRAMSVQKLLVDRGVGEAQVEVIGMGIKDPIATNDTPAGRLKNRRVEIEIIDDGV